MAGMPKGRDKEGMAGMPKGMAGVPRVGPPGQDPSGQVTKKREASRERPVDRIGRNQFPNPPLFSYTTKISATGDRLPNLENWFLVLGSKWSK